VTANSAFFGGSSQAFAPSPATDKTTFTLTIVDPCTTATVDDIVYKNAAGTTVTTLAVTDGSSGSVTFTRPLTSPETETGRFKFCGETSFSIHSDGSGSNFSYTSGWAVITGPVAGVYTLTVDTTKDLTLIANEASVNINIFVKATVDDYTANSIEKFTSFQL
jgi:hypothetical protein